MNKRRAKQNLIDIYELLKSININSWLCCGTLLGAIREKDFIDHDNDVDLGIFADSVTNEDVQNIKNILVSNGFKLNKEFFKLNEGLGLQFTRFYVHTDLYFLDKTKVVRSIPNLKSGGTFEFEKSISMYCPNFQDKSNPYIYDFPEYIFESFINIDFVGHSFLIPKHYDDFLTLMYGDWTVVNKYKYGHFKNINRR